jgi:hypothetical protein
MEIFCCFASPLLLRRVSCTYWTGGWASLRTVMNITPLFIFYNFNVLICGLVVTSSWLQIQGPGFDSRRYQIFWEILGLERGPLSLVGIIEELLEWKSSGSALENRDLTAVEIRCADHATPSIRKKLALTSPTSNGRSVGIVRLRTKSHRV